MSAPERPGRLLWNVVWKGLLLFLIFNLLLPPFRRGWESLGLQPPFPGRARFPFGENPAVLQPEPVRRGRHVRLA